MYIRAYQMKMLATLISLKRPYYKDTNTQQMVSGISYSIVDQNQVKPATNTPPELKNTLIGG